MPAIMSKIEAAAGTYVTLETVNASELQTVLTDLRTIASTLVGEGTVVQQNIVVAAINDACDRLETIVNGMGEAAQELSDGINGV
jgi:prophage DNA circulation protein